MAVRRSVEVARHRACMCGGGGASECMDSLVILSRVN